MIEFERVSRRFGDQNALRNLNLTIEQGEMAFLTGHSGAGKVLCCAFYYCWIDPTAGTSA